MHYLPADVLVFSGEGPMSRVIRAATCSKWSHVGIVVWMRRGWVQYCLRADQDIAATWKDRLLLFESTTMGNEPCEITGKKVSGVQAHSLESYVESYPGGVWRIKWPTRLWMGEDASRRLAMSALDCIGRKYDEPGAALSATQLLKRWLSWAQNRKRLYCVEMVAELVKEMMGDCEASRSLRPGQMTPADYVKWAKAHDFVLQQVK